MTSIAVLIPAFNEERLLARAIRSVHHAGIRLEHIFVVDDGSSDGTFAVAQASGACAVSFVNGGKSAAIANGLAHFGLLDRFTHVGIMDADSQMHPEYFYEMRRAISRHPDAALFCGGPESLPCNWITAFRAVEYAVTLGIYRPAQDALGVINVAPGCASLYRSEALRLLDMGGDTLVEDMDLTIQLQRMGRSVVFVEKAKVFTQDPRRLKDFIGQMARWHRGTWQVVRKHGLGFGWQRIDLEVGALLAEGLFFAVMTVLWPLLLWRYPFAALASLALDQALSFSLTAIVAINRRRWDLVCAFPLFLALRYLGAAVFLWAFLVERRRPRTLPTWFCVTRY